METLIKALEKLYGESNNSYVCEEDSKAYFKNDETYIAVIGFCNEYLITEDGLCNWKNIGVLKEAGYYVYAGEKDSFGWLTGCVQKKGDNRIVVYG